MLSKLPQSAKALTRAVDDEGSAFIASATIIESPVAFTPDMSGANPGLGNALVQSRYRSYSMRRIAPFLLLLLLLVFARAAWADGPDAPLQPDPRWFQGSLENGVRYCVRTHDAVEGRLVLHLIVVGGSLEELRSRPGAAFLTAMLTHAGALESPVGKAVLSLAESLPVGVVASKPVITQDNVSFTVVLPIANEKSIALGMRHLREIVQGAGLDDASIMSHRPQVRARRAELITRKERLLAAVMPQIAPLARVTLHPAIPADAALCALEAADVRTFHSRAYIPSRCIIVASGDTDAKIIVDRIRAEFSTIAQPMMRDADPEPAAAGPEAPRGLRAAVAADPELRQAIAEVVVIHEGQEPVRTAARAREALVAELASIILHRRLTTSQPVVRGGGVHIGPATGGASIAVASVMGDPDDWKALLSALTSSVSRAREIEPSPEEMDSARQALLKNRSEAVAAEPTMDPRDLVDAAARSLARDDALIAPEVEFADAQERLPGITPDEVRAALAERFPFRDAAFTLFMPDGAGTPPPVDVLTAVLPAMIPEPGAPRPRADRDVERQAYASTPAPADNHVASLAVEPSLGVSTARFTNGVRFAHRRMAGSEPRIVISATLRRPAAAEGEPSAPLEALSILFSAPATRAESAESLRRAMDRHRIELRSQVGPRLARLELTAPPDSAREAFRMLHDLITEPSVDPIAFDRWRWSMQQWAARRATDPMTAVFEAVSGSLRNAGCVAAWQPTDSEIAGLRAETVQQWIAFTVAAAPIDVALVGDLSRAEALTLATEYLGALPERSPAAGAGIAPCTPNAELAEHRLQTRGPGAESVVLVAIHGSAGGAREEAAMDLAARVLTARLASRPGEQTGPGEIAVKHLTEQDLAGTPMLLAVGSIGARLSGVLVERLDHAFSALAADGPSEAELLRARADAVDEFDRQRSDSAWWARALSHPITIDQGVRSLADSRDLLTALSRDEVREAFAAHDPESCCGRTRLRVIVTPSAP